MGQRKFHKGQQMSNEKSFLLTLCKCLQGYKLLWYYEYLKIVHIFNLIVPTPGFWTVDTQILLKVHIGYSIGHEKASII